MARKVVLSRNKLGPVELKRDSSNRGRACEVAPLLPNPTEPLQYQNPEPSNWGPWVLKLCSSWNRKSGFWKAREVVSRGT